MELFIAVLFALLVSVVFGVTLFKLHNPEKEKRWTRHQVEKILK